SLMSSFYRLTSVFVVLVMRREKRVLDLSPSKSSNSSWSLGWSLRSVGLPHGIRGLVDEGEYAYPWIFEVQGKREEVNP
ncbi:hypothetical protein Tco_0361521, partial [Tanacetum coccineum]